MCVLQGYMCLCVKIAKYWGYTLFNQLSYGLGGRICFSNCRSGLYHQLAGSPIGRLKKSCSALSIPFRQSPVPHYQLLLPLPGRGGLRASVALLRQGWSWPEHPSPVNSPKTRGGCWVQLPGLGQELALALKSGIKGIQPISCLELLATEGQGAASNQQPGELPLDQHIISKLSVCEARLLWCRQSLEAVLAEAAESRKMRVLQG